MPSEKDKILEFNQSLQSDKMPSIIQADMESLIKKTDGCANNPKNVSQQKQVEHIRQQFGHLITKETKILYTAEKIV